VLVPCTSFTPVYAAERVAPLALWACCTARTAAGWAVVRQELRREPGLWWGETSLCGLSDSTDYTGGGTR